MLANRTRTSSSHFSSSRLRAASSSALLTASSRPRSVDVGGLGSKAVAERCPGNHGVRSDNSRCPSLTSAIDRGRGSDPYTELRRKNVGASGFDFGWRGIARLSSTMLSSSSSSPNGEATSINSICSPTASKFRPRPIAFGDDDSRASRVPRWSRRFFQSAASLRTLGTSSGSDRRFPINKMCNSSRGDLGGGYNYDLTSI